jgi:Rieske Fe-S protein
VSIEGITRRNTLTGAVVVGVGVPLLAACGSDSGSDTSEPQTKAGEKLGPSTDVPVGGGMVFADQKVVVTQPSKGDFKGFTAVCTHEGCVVANVQDGTINCTCHGSKFSIQDGSVVNGPASSPLASIDVADQGGQITTA